MNKNKKIYFEILRIIACVLVLFNHTEGYRLYQISSGIKQIFYMTLTMITRINVPLFFMVSGALLLNKEESYRDVFKKRISRFLLIIVLFEALIYCVNKYNAILSAKEYEFTLYAFIRGVLSMSIDGTGSYWYLYSYTGFLFMLPLLQRITKKINKEDIIVILFIHFLICSFVPFTTVFLNHLGLKGIWITNDFAVPLATSKYLFYPLMGYYLEHNVDITKIKFKTILGMVAILCLGIGLSCYATQIEALMKGAYSQNYVQLFDYITAIVVFVIIKVIFVKYVHCNETSTKILNILGSMTFGVYLLEPVAKILFYDKFIGIIESSLPTLLVSFFWVILCFSICSFSTMIMKKLPIVKKIL